MLADGVDLVDGGGTAQQGVGQRLHVGQRHPLHRQRHQGRSAPGDQAHHQVVLAGVLQQGGDRPRARYTGLVRDRMARLSDGYDPRRGRMAVLDVHVASSDPVAQYLLDGLRHGSARLARADHQHATVGIEIIRHIAHQQ